MNNTHKLEDHEEVMGENHHNDDEPQPEGIVFTLQFPIWQPVGQAPMKNISSSVLPHFHGKATEDLNKFLFYFDILCCSYDYTSSEQKLKFFPATLKDNGLHWLMILGGETSTKWDQMKQVFLENNQEYCNTKDKREELFKMVQRDKESLEYFVERILYNVQRAGHNNMGLYVLKIILLHGIREEFLGMLNLLGKGDISKESFESIVELWRRYSRGSSGTKKRDKLEWDVFDRTQKSSNGGATRE